MIKIGTDYYALVIHNGGLYVLKCNGEMSLYENLILHEKEHAWMVTMVKTHDEAWAWYEHFVGNDADEYGGINTDVVESVEESYWFGMNMTTQENK